MIGSAVRPERAGPMTSPTPQAQDKRERPSAWLLSVDVSDMAALAATATPEQDGGKEEVREVYRGKRKWTRG